MQVIQIGLEKKIVGFTYGRDYIPYNPDMPQEALEKIRNALLQYWNQLFQQQQMAQKQLLAKQYEIEANQKIEKERKDNEAKIGLGILAGLIILGVAGSSN